jgi:chromosome segregation ATPase
MTKIFLLLTAAAAGFAALKAWGNKEEYATLKDEIATLEEDATSLKNKFKRIDAQYTDTADELEKQGAARDEEKFRVELNREKLNSRSSAVATAQGEVNGMKAQIDQMMTIIRRSTGGGSDPAELQAKRESAADQKTELETSIIEQEALLESAKARVNERRAVLAGLRKTISDNAAQFNVRTRRASISAVDLEWNFAEINMGDTKGIDVNDRVIVERSGQRVGMLVVKTVGRGQIIGNIVPEAGGGAIQAGDSVVFDKKEEES